jgi:GNAT superfamily N-acetyltransferase
MTEPITLRTVEKFPEPEFTALVNRLLHDPDRAVIGPRLFQTLATPPTPTQAQQVRIGAYAGDVLIGWSHAFNLQGGVMYVGSSAVEPEFRRQGVYTRLVGAMEEEARALGCFQIESHHRTGNADVLIAKLKLGYLVVGTEFTVNMGVLVKLSKQLEPSRHAVFAARSGVVEGSVRFFDAACAKVEGKS